MIEFPTDRSASVPAIEMQAVTVKFGATPVVDGFSLTVAPGAGVALWGPNGSGKTTLIRTLLALVRFTGKVSVCGYDVSANPREARRHVGYVPQRPAFYDDLSGLAYLEFIAGLRRLPKGEAVGLLERVGLARHAAKRLGAYSGGMRQRLALAAALLGSPPVLVLDEPTANLDPDARADLVLLLAEQRAAGTTLVLATHRRSDVSELADRVVPVQGDAPVRMPLGFGDIGVEAWA